MTSTKTGWTLRKEIPKQVRDDGSCKPGMTAKRHAERSPVMLNLIQHLSVKEIPDQVRDDGGGRCGDDGSCKPGMTAKRHAERSPVMLNLIQHPTAKEIPKQVRDDGGGMFGMTVAAGAG